MGKKCDGSEHLTEGDEIKLFLAEETIEKFSEVKIQKVQKKKARYRLRGRTYFTDQ